MDKEGPSSGSPESPQPARPGWGRWTAVGFEFGAAVVLFFLLGRYLDARWGTPPWLTVVGMFTGVVIGTYMLVRQALRGESGTRAHRE